METINELSKVYRAWVDSHALPQFSADELWHEIWGMIEDEKNDTERASLKLQADTCKAFLDLFEAIEREER